MKTSFLWINYYVIETLNFYLFHGNQLQKHWTRGALQDWPGRYRPLIMEFGFPSPCPARKVQTLLIVNKANAPFSMGRPAIQKLFITQEVRTQKKQTAFLGFYHQVSCSYYWHTKSFVFLNIAIDQPGFVYYLGLNVMNPYCLGLL